MRERALSHVLGGRRSDCGKIPARRLPLDAGSGLGDADVGDTDADIQFARRSEPGRDLRSRTLDYRLAGYKSRCVGQEPMGNGLVKCRIEVNGIWKSVPPAPAEIPAADDLGRRYELRGTRPSMTPIH